MAKLTLKLDFCDEELSFHKIARPSITLAVDSAECDSLVAMLAYYRDFLSIVGFSDIDDVLVKYRIDPTDDNEYPLVSSRDDV